MSSKTLVYLLNYDYQDYGNQHILKFYGRSHELGPVELIFNNNKPNFFIPSSSKLPDLPFEIQRKSLPLKDLHKMEPVDCLYFNSQKELRLAKEKFIESQITTFESDVHPCDRFLMERFISSSLWVQGDFEQKAKIASFLNPKIKFCPEIYGDLKVASIDIETGVNDPRLYSIGIQIKGIGFDERKVFMLAEKSQQVSDLLSFYSSEREVIINFLNYFKVHDPDLIIGWNVIGFDLHYLDKKCAALGLPFNLGRDGSPLILTQKTSGGFFSKITGRVVLDGPTVLRSNFFSFEDFKLETVAQELLGRGKEISVSDNSKIAEIERQFREEKEKLAQYNIMDCVLVTEIFEQTKILDLLLKRTQFSGLLLDKLAFSSSAFDHNYLPRLHRKGFVAPNADDVLKVSPAEGGHVLEPELGIHPQIFVLDFKSLYPSIIRSFKIDPLSLQMAKDNPIETPDGYKFSREDHILPEIIAGLLSKREQAKNQGDQSLSQAIKILMNSFYGVMGSSSSRFYHSDLPQAITSTGRWILKESKNFLNDEGYEVVYGDTDSLFVKKEAAYIENPFEYGNRLASRLNLFWQNKIENDFKIESFLVVEFEKFYKKLLLPAARTKEGAAKKKYAGLLKGGDGEQLHFVGLEAVRSDWTKLAKEFQKELYLKIFKEEEIKSWIKETVKKLQEGEFDNLLVYKKRLRRKVEDYTKSIPPHVKAAKMLENPGKTVKYVMTLRGPVPIQLEPKDLDYEHYIDKQLKPIADSVLEFVDLEFDKLVKAGYFSQKKLFMA